MHKAQPLIRVLQNYKLLAEEIMNENKILNKLEQDFTDTRIVLIEEMERLSRLLERRASDLKLHKTAIQPHLSINAMGEIQGLGTKIDALCAKLVQIERTVKLIHNK